MTRFCACIFHMWRGKIRGGEGGGDGEGRRDTERDRDTEREINSKQQHW